MPPPLAGRANGDAAERVGVRPRSGEARSAGRVGERVRSWWGARCVESGKLTGVRAVSTEAQSPLENGGGKTQLVDAAAEAKRLADEAAAEERERQMDLLEPLTAEELADAQEELGALAKPLAVMRAAREKRTQGRPKGARNRRTKDTLAYLSQFGPDPAVAMMRIIGDSEEAMVERSRAIDPVKRQLSYGDARAMRIRCAETMIPYFHGKQPVQVDATIRGVVVREEIGDLKGVRGRTIDGEIKRVLGPDEWESGE